MRMAAIRTGLLPDKYDELHRSVQLHALKPIPSSVKAYRPLHSGMEWINTLNC